MIHFKEHLNKNGKIILFWPPKYGLSVIALHIIHFIINKIFKMKLKLHQMSLLSIQIENK